MSSDNIRKVRAPVRIDFAGGTTDIYPFTYTHGGAVLNATINRYVAGKIIKTDKKVHLEYSGNIPTSSGLGTSGVMNLVWLTLISQKKNIVFKDKIELAEKVYKLEQATGVIGGKQDQYASALGGINFLEFKSDKVKINKLNLKKSFVKELEKSLVLVYTGKAHYAGSSNKKSIDNLRRGKNTQELINLKNIAIEMKNSLMKNDLSKFSGLMNQETKEREKLHKTMIIPKTRDFIRQGLKSGATGAKICGSGNGGSILFFGNKRKLIKKFNKNIINFKFDFEGLKIL